MKSFQQYLKEEVTSLEFTETVFDFGEIMENENSINIKNDDMDFQRTVTKSNGVSCYKWNWFGEFEEITEQEKINLCLF